MVTSQLNDEGHDEMCHVPTNDNNAGHAHAWPVFFWCLIDRNSHVMKSGRSHPHNGCDSVWPNATAKLLVNLSRNKELVHHQNTEPQDQKLKDWMVVEHQEGVI